MTKEQMTTTIKCLAFDEILKMSKVNASYFKRAEAIFDMLNDAESMVKRAERNGK